jgi:hypothetical protein
MREASGKLLEEFQDSHAFTGTQVDKGFSS